MLDQKPVTNSPIVATPSTGSSVLMPGSSHTFKLVSADTAGQFALMEATIHPHALVIPHIHTGEDELSIVLEGEAGVRIGDHEFQVGPGSYIFVPRGTPQAVWNSTDTPVKAITIFTPAGLENYFEEMSHVFQASNPPDFAMLGTITQKYGIINVMDWVPELTAKYDVHMG